MLNADIENYPCWSTYLEHCNINPLALRKAKIVNSFGLSECNRVNTIKKKLVSSHNRTVCFSVKPIPKSL